MHEPRISHRTMVASVRNVRLGSVLRVTKPNLQSKVISGKLTVTQLAYKYLTFNSFRWLSGKGHQLQFILVLKTQFNVRWVEGRLTICYRDVTSDMFSIASGYFLNMTWAENLFSAAIHKKKCIVFSENSIPVPTKVWLGACKPPKYECPNVIRKCPQHNRAGEWAACDSGEPCWLRVTGRQQALRMGLWPELQPAHTTAARDAATAEARSKYTQESRRRNKIYQGSILRSEGNYNRLSAEQVS